MLAIAVAVETVPDKFDVELVDELPDDLELDDVVLDDPPLGVGLTGPTGDGTGSR